MNRSVVVLGNPAARGRTDDLDATIDLLSQQGVEPQVVLENSGERTLTAAHEAVAAGADRVIVVGGDGLVSLALQAVAATSTVLGIVPDGTGNDFARGLGLLEGTLADRVHRAMDAPAAVDAIRTDHGWVASVATLGFSGDVTDRANRLRWPRGQQRYTVATLLQLPRLRTLPVRTVVDGEPFGASTTLLAIGNTAYFGGGMQICPGAAPDDGRLHVVSIDDVPRRTFLRVFPTVFRGRHVERPEVRTTTGAAVELAGADVDVWADGERLGPLPITLTLVRRALRVAGHRPSRSRGAPT